MTPRCRRASEMYWVSPRFNHVGFIAAWNVRESCMVSKRRYLTVCPDSFWAAWARCCSRLRQRCLQSQLLWPQIFSDRNLPKLSLAWFRSACGFWGCLHWHQHQGHSGRKWSKVLTCLRNNDHIEHLDCRLADQYYNHNTSQQGLDLLQVTQYLHFCRLRPWTQFQIRSTQKWPSGQWPSSKVNARKSLSAMWPSPVRKESKLACQSPDIMLQAR